MITRLECVSNYHYKFWEAELLEDSATLIVRWGRIGTTGQSKTYQFALYTLASLEFHKKVGEKIRKGYRDIATSQSSPNPQTIEEVQEETKPTGHRSLSKWMSL